MALGKRAEVVVDHSITGLSCREFCLRFHHMFPLQLNGRLERGLRGPCGESERCSPPPLHCPCRGPASQGRVPLRAHVPRPCPLFLGHRTAAGLHSQSGKTGLRVLSPRLQQHGHRRRACGLATHGRRPCRGHPCEAGFHVAHADSGLARRPDRAGTSGCSLTWLLVADFGCDARQPKGAGAPKSM